MDNIISFGDARLKRKPLTDCRHVRLEYDDVSRLVKCMDCNHFIEGFDAFMVLVNQYDRFWARIKQAKNTLEKDRKLLNTRINTLAAKNLDKAWSGRKMAVCCPHCSGGLIPEDFHNGITSSFSYELEIKKRQKEITKSKLENNGEGTDTI